MKLKKNQIAKIILLLLLILILNFAFPIRSNAGFFSGIITKPICFFVVQLTDSVNRMLSVLLVPPEKEVKDVADEFWKAMNENGDLFNAIAQADYAGLMSPDKIFAGDSTLLDANIFEAKDFNGTFEDIWKEGNGAGIASALKKGVSNVYVLLRNISAVILLCLLIFTGIRILLMSASPYNQAKWKSALIDWLKALCSLMLMHFLMIGIFYISDLIVASLSEAMGGTNIVMQIRNAYANNSIWDDSEAIVTTIMYVYVTYLTLVFAIAYFKRLVWTVVLIVISPIVAVTQALGQKQSQIFSRWLKEYAYNVFLQPFHMLIFFVLVGIPLGVLGNNTQGWDIGSKFAFDINNSNTWGVYIYILIAISMIRPAEKFLYKLFGFGESSVARQGTSESGVRTMKAAIDTVKQVVTTAVQVGATVMTAGTAAAAMGATGALGTAGKAGQIANEGIKMADQLNSGNEDQDGKPKIGENNPGDDNDENQETGEKDNQLTLDDYKHAQDLEKIADDYDENFGTSDWDPQESAALHQNAQRYLEEVAQNKDLNKIDEVESATDKSIKSGDKSNIDVDKLSINAGKVDISGDKPSEAGGKLEKTIDEEKTAGEEKTTSEEKITEFTVSDEEFNASLGSEEGNNALMDRLKRTFDRISDSFDEIAIPETKQSLNDLWKSGNQLRDTMYLDGDSPKEYERGYNVRKEKYDLYKKENLNAFVNNDNNIKYMEEKYGCSAKEAKERLQAGEPFVNKGITNVVAVDAMIDGLAKGQDPKQAIKSYIKTENVINNENNLQAIQQIVATKTGKEVDSAMVKEAARDIMQQARPYIEIGQDNPEVLQRLVQLESKLKQGGASKELRKPEKVLVMDKFINDAIKKNLKEVKISKDDNNIGMKKLQTILNKELADRKGLNGFKTISPELNNAKTRKTSTSKTNTAKPKQLNSENTTKKN